ncbi:DUF5060 domain-containing protein [Acidobacteria bacterium AH-259-L09]|nr:DUF5060 domain-containing protein [Acidobacteria bacterium AH-259-L09]
MNVNNALLSGRLFVRCSLAIVVCCTPSLLGAEVSGELKRWHKVTLTFDGPQTSEDADQNPFLHYRLNVRFTHGQSGRTYLVPGYFAADGNAAETGSKAGRKWRAHFTPDQLGTWTYQVSFRQGQFIAVSDMPNAGEAAGFMDRETSSFEIGPTDKSGRDFRAKGRLQYVGKHHLRFAHTGEYFLKFGADAPENFLAYADFDGGFKNDGRKDELIKTWTPHIRDWKEGDPVWRNGKGKGIIGALNYLASKGMNAFSFLTLSTEGDDQNVFPYVSYEDYERFDVSKLDQWEIVFEHADKLGLYLHFKTQEAENQGLLDGGGLGVHRKLYYRQLIARFSHHLALNWNLGEENGEWGREHRTPPQDSEQRRAMARYFHQHDPYGHHVVIHNGRPFDDLLGESSKLTGASVQTNRTDFSNVYDRVREWIEKSRQAGRPWVVSCDEPGDAQHSLLPDAEDPKHDNARKNALWGVLMAGGAGIEWYFGYRHAHSDLTCQDWRSRDLAWDQSRHASRFFSEYKIPFWDMSARNELSLSNDWVLAGRDEAGRWVVVVYLKDGGQTQINLPFSEFEYGWFDPRGGTGLGGLLQPGSVIGTTGSAFTAPDQNDWVLLVRQKD